MVYGVSTLLESSVQLDGFKSAGQFGVVARYMEHFSFSMIGRNSCSFSTKECIICSDPGIIYVPDSIGGVSAIMPLVPIAWQQAMDMSCQGKFCNWEGKFQAKRLEITFVSW